MKPRQINSLHVAIIRWMECEAQRDPDGFFAAMSNELVDTGDGYLTQAEVTLHMTEAATAVCDAAASASGFKRK